VLQDPVLFAASIAENIAYGKPDASDGEIIAAAQAASSHEFITNLPEGYETRPGERGMLLSGGERQRISLARAFLRDSPILILDEPTSSIDGKTEARILQATEDLMRGRTTFMIAHRLNTLKNCDLILVLEQGQLVEIRETVPEAFSASAR
jgi:ATP-binding cassette, subfamily B, bacterial